MRRGGKKKLNKREIHKKKGGNFHHNHPETLGTEVDEVSSSGKKRF